MACDIAPMISTVSSPESNNILQWWIASCMDGNGAVPVGARRPSTIDFVDHMPAFPWSELPESGTDRHVKSSCGGLIRLGFDGSVRKSSYQSWTIASQRKQATFLAASVASPP